MATELVGEMCMCVVCEEEVKYRHKDAVECEMCAAWTHAKCAGLAITTSNKPLLKHQNLVYLCDPCLETSRLLWVRHRTRPEVCESGVQTEVVEGVTEAVEVREIEVQTEEVGKGGDEKATQTCTNCPRVRKAVRRRPPIRVVGDSMIRRVNDQIGCWREGSGVDSLSGAKIEEVRRKVEERASEVEDGFLIIQGGGNDLEAIGSEDTVGEVVAAVKAVEGKNVSVAVVGVMRRPREGERYEGVRQRTNARLQEELLKIKLEWLKERKGNVSFLDLDGVLREREDFAADGVHLNTSGYFRMGKRLREWVSARSAQCMGMGV